MTNTITIIDLEKNKVTERPLTNKEIEINEKFIQQGIAEKAKQEQNKASRLSALEKLAALGLTPEEIAAITG
tara:strand:+ start:152 stop:367 length:216 start_codon:yes stop_codon:yes gene_type:complete